MSICLPISSRLQKKMVEDLLTISNRILESTATRSQFDPQLFAEKLPMREVLQKPAKSVLSSDRRSSSSSDSISSSYGSESGSKSTALSQPVTSVISSSENFSLDECQEEKDIKKYKTNDSRFKEVFSFEPGRGLQFEAALAARGHKQYVNVRHCGVPPTKNEEAMRVEPAPIPSLPLIRKPILYTAS